MSEDTNLGQDAAEAQTGEGGHAPSATVPSDEAQQRAAEAEQKAAAADALAAAFARVQEGASKDADEQTTLPAIEGSVGLGVDIVEIDRMQRILERTPSFRTRVYSEDERAYCDKMARPAVHYATRFAAKEAVLKALGTGFSEGIAPADVEVQRASTGRPMARLHRKAAEVAKRLGVKEIPISLSYTHNEAVACAMAITYESVKVAEERVNPMDELARQFKDARAMLDELPATENAPVKRDEAATAAESQMSLFDAAGNDETTAPEPQDAGQDAQQGTGQDTEPATEQAVEHSAKQETLDENAPAQSAPEHDDSPAQDEQAQED